MSLRNIVEISTAFGFRSVELHHGDLSQLEFQVDALCVSAFTGDYVPVHNTLIGSLKNNCGLDVAEMVASPHIDFRAQMGVWLSQKLADQNFNFLAGVEMLRLNDGSGCVHEAVRSLFSLFLVAEMHDVEIRSVAMPLLGAGLQGVDPTEVLPQLMIMTQKVLRSSPLLNRVIFMDISEDRVDQLDFAMNEFLQRSPAHTRMIPQSQLADAIKAELLASLRTLHPLVPHLPTATETIGTLIHQLDSGVARFFEIGSQARRFTESLVLDLLDKTHTDNLLDSIRIVSQTNIARWIINYMHTLRVFGNEAAHTSSPKSTFPSEVAENDVLTILFSLNRLADFWAMHRHRVA